MMLWLAWVSASALAHHGTATTVVSMAAPTPEAPSEPVEAVQGRVGTTYDLTSVDQRVQGRQRDALRDLDSTDDVVTLHRVTVSAGLAMPGQRTVDLLLPVGMVHDGSGNDLGPGDATVLVGQGLGRRARLHLSGGITAPTGRYERSASLSELDMQGSPDGTLTLATYDTRASLGAGSWSALASASGELPLATAAVRARAGLTQPLSRTPEGYRWGRDTLLGGALVAPPLGPVAVDLGAERRWHSADDDTYVDDDTGRTTAAGARQSNAVTAGVTLTVSSRVTCRVDGRRLFGQQADGIQLMASAGASAGCRLSAPLPVGSDR